MLPAQKVVRQLLESSPYDIDDPLDRPEFPAGFTAERGDERVEMRFDDRPHFKCYRFTRSSTNPYTKKRESAGGTYSVPLALAATWLELEADRWRNGGWDVTPL